MEQLVEQLWILLYYGNKAMDITGIMIQANAELLKLESSLRGELFNTPLILQDLLTDSC